MDFIQFLNHVLVPAGSVRVELLRQPAVPFLDLPEGGPLAETEKACNSLNPMPDDPHDHEGVLRGCA